MTNQKMSQTNHDNPRVFYGYIIVAVALMIMLLGYGIRTIFGVFIKPMLTEFEWTRALTSGAMTLSMVTQGIWGIVMGRLNDKTGPRLLITLCCFLMGTGFILMSQIKDLWQIYLFYGVVIGLGMGGVFVILLSTVARWFVKRRGTMMGIVLTGIGFSSLVMSPLATWLIEIYNWRVAYMVVGCIVLISGIILAQFLKRDPGTIGLKPYGQSESAEQKMAINSTGLSLKEAIGTQQFWITAALFLFIGYSMFAIMIHIVPHVTDIGISPVNAAFVLALIGVGNVVGGITLGDVADRIGNRRILAIGFILMGISIFVLLPNTEIWIFFVAALIFGIGNGASGVAEPTIVAELFGLKSHGVILGVVSFLFTVGGAIGPLVTGHLFDISGNYDTAFLISGLVCIGGLILTALLRPIKKQAV
jgi:MFS family permease